MTRDIEFGYSIPGYGKYEDPAAWKRLARAAEEAGFDAIWTGDHITIPDDLRYEEYQFGVPDWADMENPITEVFGVLSFIAGVTDDIHVGTNICVVPLRHPILLAKQAMTLDTLTDGGLEFGVGAGWLRSEFEVMDAPFEERGGRTDEFLEIFHEACETGEVAYDGDYYSFEKTGFYPIPEGDSPRVWVGGTSGAAIRRTAEFGDGWVVVERSAEEVGETRDRIMNAWSDFDRDGTPEIGARRTLYIGEKETDRDAAVGSPDDIREDVQQYVDAGTTHYMIGTLASDLEEEIDQLHRFGDEIID